MKMDNIINHYMVRHTQKQKHNFLEYSIKQFQAKGYTSQIQKVRVLGIPNYNLIIGDIKKAKVIFTAHYDTPNTFIGGVTMYPFSFIKSLFSQLKVLIIPFIIWLLVDSYFYPFGYWIFAILCILLCFTFTNKNNYNDNTSGVLTIYRLAEALKGYNHIAFVLFDNEEKGLLGSMGFARKNKCIAKNTLFINFDCVANGNHILLGSSKKTLSVAQQICNHHICNNKFVKPFIKKNPLLMSDDANFKNAIQVMVFNGKDNQLILDRIHTNKDTILDSENIDYITKMMKQFVIEHVDITTISNF